MVILGEVLVVGGSALVCAAQFSGPGPPSNKSSCRDRMRLWANRRKSRDDEKPRHGSGRRGRRSDHHLRPLPNCSTVLEERLHGSGALSG